MEPVVSQAAGRAIGHPLPLFKVHCAEGFSVSWVGRAAENARGGQRLGPMTHPHLPGRLGGQGGSLLDPGWGLS